MEDLKKLTQYISPVNKTFYLNIFKTAFNSANGDTGTGKNDVGCVDGKPNNPNLDEEFIN